MGALWSMDKKLVMLRAQIRLLCCVFVQDAFPVTVPLTTHKYIYVICWAVSPYVKKTVPVVLAWGKSAKSLNQDQGHGFSPYGLTLRPVNNLFFAGFLLFLLIWS